MTPGPEAAEHPKELRVPPINRTTLALFAGASGDHNPIHIDIDVAQSAGLDDVFAHGMLSAAYMARLLTDNFPLESLRSYRVRFTAVTPVHAEQICQATIEQVDTPDGEPLIILGLTSALSDGAVVLTGEAVLASPDSPPQVHQTGSNHGKA